MNHCCSAEQLKVKKFLFDSQCESEEYSSETGPHHNMWSSHSLQPFKLTSHNNQLQQSSSRGTVKLQGNPIFLSCYSCVKDVNSDLDESASSWSSEYLQTEHHCTWCGKRNLQKRISSHCWYDWQWCWSWSHGWCWEYEMCNMWCEYWSSLIINDHHTHPLISTSNIFTQLLLFKHLHSKEMFWMKS